MECDYNPSSYRKGKNRPFTILKNSEKFMHTIDKLSDLCTWDIPKVYLVKLKRLFLEDVQFK